MAQWTADARYTRVVGDHAESLLHLAYLVTGNRGDAEDAVQNAIIAVAPRWHGLRDATALAYLRRAVTNAAIDTVRRRREHPTDAVPERAVDDAGLLRYEDDERFFAHLRALPEGQRAVLVLRYHADLGDREIARTLGITPVTVRTQAHRALASLRATWPTGAAAEPPTPAAAERSTPVASESTRPGTAADASDGTDR
ncbi:sigma-70 family RNA polymerase sigma factor [Galbitalea sp. SE-J8]|uniref:sigma-70 family RNA polymerase sigma factor n=1 Tax=Galbitalea sp. SE-J8 TaxID=3054952 RepID=UPI00259CC0A2|nr:sigma-70 family RNA polymerase sigma factor [Galbitalea sp. SE-J8]MDM4762138.1 sigma-70 family RNA polymerase sigma factor [Galbitalea sp. SE-J8]